MRVGSKVLRWNLDGKTLEIRRGEEKGKERGEGAMLQSPIPSFRSCALVRSLLFAKVPGRRRTERDNRPEIWFSPLSSLLSVPVTEDNDPKSAAASG